MTGNGKFTRDEILRQPKTWKSTLKKVKKWKEDLKRLISERKTYRLVFYGCGSSYHSALSAAKVFQRHSAKESLPLPSSELLLFPEILFKGRKEENTILIPISRSGDTTETVKATKLAVKDYASRVLSFTCYSESKLGDLSDFIVSLKDAREESVVQTRSFTSILWAIIATALILSENHSLTDLDEIPKIGEKLIENSFSLVERIFAQGEYDNFVFLGAGPIYGAAMESMLKMKEMAIENTEGYYPLEYRHGPKSTLSEQTLITLFTSDSGRKYEEDLVEELKEYGADVVVLSEEGSNADPDYELEMNSGFGEYTRIPLYVIFGQVMGLKRAREKGIDPDNPRHLDGVVELND